MGATKDMWMDDIEECAQLYICGTYDEEDFRKRMNRLGFYPAEIEEHLSALSEDRENT